MNEMHRILDICFEGKQRVDPKGFRQINEDISSDTVLAVLGLFRERLPCSENFWRYKRNYDLHTKMMNKKKSEQGSPVNDSESVASGRSQMKRLASPKMRHVRALSPYANARGTEQGPGDGPKMSFLSMAAGGANIVADSDESPDVGGMQSKSVMQQRAVF